MVTEIESSQSVNQSVGTETVDLYNCQRLFEELSGPSPPGLTTVGCEITHQNLGNVDSEVAEALRKRGKTRKAAETNVLDAAFILGLLLSVNRGEAGQMPTKSEILYAKVVRLRLSSGGCERWIGPRIISLR